MSNYAEVKATIQERMQALKDEMQALGTSFFKEESASVFADFPDVASFSWSQYTPYFNDGDECVFGVNDFYRVTTLSGIDGADTDYQDLYYSTWRSESDPTYNAKNALAKRLDNLVGGIDADVMKALFGDHVRVVVNRDGTIETEYYDHD